MQYNFGSGTLFIKNDDVNGVSSVPVQCGTLQDINIDISFETKELRGGLQFAVDTARAGGKITGKAKFAQIAGTLINKIVGGTLTSGATVIGNANQIATLASGQTITVANITGWKDLGVYNQTDGKFMARVASAPATGQYSCALGVYTFASADATDSVAISYSYTSATGNTILLQNEPMGTSINYILECYNTYKGKSIGIKLHAVCLSKFALAMKNEDFSTADVDFMAYADNNNNVISIYTTE